MDFDSLFYVAIAVAYLLSRALGGKKRKNASRRPQPTRSSQPQRERPAQEHWHTTSGQQQQQPPATESERPSELDEALREIRVALGWETPPSRPASQPPVPVAETRTETTEVPPARPIPPARAETTRGRTIPKGRLETATSGPSSPSAARPARQWDEYRSPLQDQPAPIKELSKRFEAATSTSADERAASRIRVDEIRRQLRNPASAREAFMLAEIFARRNRRL